MLLFLFVLLSQVGGTNEVPQVVTNIDLGLWDSAGSDPDSVRIGNTLYFSYLEGETTHLYISDGTAAGSKRIASLPGEVRYFYDGSQLMLRAHDVTYNYTVFFRVQGERVTRIEMQNAPMLAGFADHGFYVWTSTGALWRYSADDQAQLLYQNPKPEGYHYALPVRSGNLHYFGVDTGDSLDFKRLETDGSTTNLLSVQSASFDIARVGKVIYFYVFDGEESHVYYYNEVNGQLKKVPGSWPGIDMVENPMIPSPSGIVMMTRPDYYNIYRHHLISEDVVRQVSIPSGVGVGYFFTRQGEWYFAGEEQVFRFDRVRARLVPLDRDPLKSYEHLPPIGTDGLIYLVDAQGRSIRSDGQSREIIDLPDGAHVLQQTEKGILLSYLDEPAFLEADGTFTLLDLNRKPHDRIPQTGQLFQGALHTLTVKEGRAVLQRLEGAQAHDIVTLDADLDPLSVWPDNVFKVYGERMVIRLPEGEETAVWVSDGTPGGTFRLSLPEDLLQWDGFGYFQEDGLLWETDWNDTRVIAKVDHVALAGTNLYLTRYQDGALEVLLLDPMTHAPVLRGRQIMAQPDHLRYKADGDTLFLNVVHGADQELFLSDETGLNSLGPFLHGVRAGDLGMYLFDQSDVYLRDDAGLHVIEKGDHQLSFDFGVHPGLYATDAGDLIFDSGSGVYRYQQATDTLTHLGNGHTGGSGSVWSVRNNQLLLNKGAIYTVNLDTNKMERRIGWLLGSHLIGRTESRDYLYIYDNFNGYGDSRYVVSWDGDSIEPVIFLDIYLPFGGLNTNLRLVGESLYFRGYTSESGFNWWHLPLAPVNEVVPARAARILKMKRTLRVNR